MNCLHGVVAVTGDTKERKTFSLDAELVEELDEECNNASAVMNQLLSEFLMGGGEGPIGLEIKLQRTERKLQDALDERERVNRRIEKLRNKRNRIESQIEAKTEEKQEEIKMAAENLEGTPRDPENPAVQNWAENVGVPATELLRRIEDLEVEQ